MFRRELPGNDGMLFVFENPDVQCFWMRNTLLPLSIAFITDDGTIVNIEDMAPQTEDPHCSKKPVALRAGNGAGLVREAWDPGRPQDRRIAVGALERCALSRRAAVDRQSLPCAPGWRWLRRLDAKIWTADARRIDIAML